LSIRALGCTLWLNVPSMPVAAFATYGASIGKNVYNITPWINFKLPYRD
jgi:hypothetical protein